MRNERGSVLVFGLMVVMGVVVLVSALGSVMNTGRSVDKFNEERISADYKAEAAIEKALNLIVKRQNHYFADGELTNKEAFEGELEGITGSLTEPDDYKVTKAEIETDSGVIKFHITGWGRSGKTEKEIETTLAPKPMSIVNPYPVIAEGSVTGGVNAGQEVETTGNGSGNGNQNQNGNGNGGNDNNSSVPIVFSPAAQSDLGEDGVPGLREDSDETTGTFTFYKNNADTTYQAGTTISLQGNETLLLNSGDVYYAAGDLTITANGTCDIISNYSDPAVVLVEGNLTLNNIRNIENAVFIVQGDIFYYGQAAHESISNTFIYSAGNVTFARDNGSGNGNGNQNQNGSGDGNGNQNQNRNGNGNSTLNPFFKITGQVLAQGDVSFATKVGSTADYAEVNLPENLDGNELGDLTYLQTVNVEIYGLKSWNERN